jgi:uncharacterized membrane protein YhhN
MVVRNRPLERVAKPLASAGFIATAVDAGALQTSYGRLVLTGLVLGGIGDVALLTERRFKVGLTAFAAGHVAYVIAFTARAPLSVVWIGFAGLIGFASVAWLLPHVERSMKFPVLAYIVIIVAMLGVALHPDQPVLVRYGAALFAASDLLVARQRFVTPSDRNRLWGLPLYYLSQILIALSTSM